MRRIVPLILALVLLALPAGATAQTTDLEAGIYVDQLTGFGIRWDPSVLSGELTEFGGLRLTGESTTGELFTTTASTAEECLDRYNSVDPPGKAAPEANITSALPSLPAGSESVAGFDGESNVFRACIADPGNPAGTTFIYLDLEGPASAGEWDAAVATWQPVIDSIVFPDPATLASTGISGNTYTDPLYGWSVQFDPERYEAQYAPGTADSTFLSGIYLYSESDLESGGIWAERHDTVDDCLAAQRAVAETSAGFSDETSYDFSPLVTEDMEAALYQIEPDESLRYLTFAACQPLFSGGEPVDGVFLVATFTVSDLRYDAAVAAWDVMLDTITFSEAAPAGTPIGN